jgi:ATP-dependent Clp protease protease subunit
MTKKQKNKLDFDLDDLFDVMTSNVKEDIKNFDDLVNLNSALNREIYIYNIEVGTGTCAESYIRFWNAEDEKNKIPVNERKPIKIYIDSYGGSLNDTFLIIDAIKMSKTPIIGIALNRAYSGGFFIFISCPKRYAYPHTSFLFHEGATGTEGTAGQFANYAAFYKKELDMLKDITISNTNITEEEYKDIKKDDIWYTSEEGIEKGFVDKILKEFYL